MKALLVILALLWPAWSWALSGTVTGIVDGDGLAIDNVPMRLYGIDAPEWDQPGGEAATAFLESLALGRRADALILDRDRYGRSVAVVHVETGNGQVCVNHALLREGHAWWVRKYCKQGEWSGCHNWRDAERAAREARLGLWNEENPTTPWAWRALRKK